MNDISKSSIRRLVEYLTDPKGNELRVGNVRVTNCVSEDIDTALEDIKLVQAQNTTTEDDKTYHLMLSFREELPDDVMHQIEDEFCEALGFGKHQRISVVHKDTDHIHLHIAINKIDPETFNIRTPFQDKRTIAKVAKRVEKEYGLIPDNHEEKNVAKETRAKSMEQAGDRESFIGFLQRNYTQKILEAKSWDEVHSLLAKDGIELKERGAGLIFTSDKFFAKASVINRAFSKKKLEEKFGAFKPNTHEIGGEKKYKVRPLQRRVGDDALWQKFLEAREAEFERRKEARKQIILMRSEELDKLNREYTDLETFMISNLVKDKIARKILFALKKGEIDAKRKELLQEYSPRKIPTQNVTWRAWLQEEAKRGDIEAIERLRSRGKIGSVYTSISGGEILQETPPAQPVKVTLNGTFLFEDGTRDTGKEFLIPRGSADEVIKTALERAVARFGKTIKVEGNYSVMKHLAAVAGRHEMDVNFTSEVLEEIRRQHMPQFEFMPTQKVAYRR